MHGVMNGEVTVRTGMARKDLGAIRRVLRDPSVSERERVNYVFSHIFIEYPLYFTVVIICSLIDCT